MAGPSNGKGKKRKRGEAHPAAAPVADANEVVDLVNLEGDRGAASAKKRHCNPPSRAGGQPTAAAASDSGWAVQQLGDVIVIED